MSLGPKTPSDVVVGLWKRLATKTKNLEDPWAEFHMDDLCREERCMRHMYNPRKKTWRKDEILVRMQDKVCGNFNTHYCTSCVNCSRVSRAAFRQWSNERVFQNVSTI